ncbi:cysteine desulfurase family protein [Corynebacterium mendelii]|uniref:Cysteine desulfurase n=1 Tax=Corynebacterium mendelii TaxID=2765362 RepID=A0A939E1Y6_9CORY|nr:cysteine desulfurase family protein [Corynebacterium mendelii]MBN9644970.1 cysteine desulfurase [Corynebacterium mendelii]
MDTHASARHYFDHAATTQLRGSARKVLVDNLDLLNPGGQYASGRKARAVLDGAREQIAGIVGCDPVEVIFTSGGTEADNIAVRGLYRHSVTANPDNRTIVCSPVEHPAVKETVGALVTHGGARQILLPVDRFGAVTCTSDCLAAVSSPAALVSCMWANNETGTIQPIDRVVHTAAKAGNPVHVDATQALGKIPVRFDEVPATTLAASAHKFGGPRGAGILLARRSPAPVAPITGGGQERGLRPGTQDVAAAAATAAALAEAVDEMEREEQRLKGLRDRLARFITATIDRAVIHTPWIPGEDTPQALAGHLSVSFPGAEGDSLIMLLDREGIECSTGSACHAGVNRASDVLLAMGVEETTARGTVRFTFGHTTTLAGIEAVEKVLPQVVERARLAGMA